MALTQEEKTKLNALRLKLGNDTIEQIAEEITYYGGLNEFMPAVDPAFKRNAAMIAQLQEYLELRKREVE